MRHRWFVIMGVCLAAGALEAGAAWAECRRVVETADATVAIIVPAYADRRAGESTADWCARAFQRTMEVNPAWQGRPFYDVDSSTLPPDRSQRHKWRYRGDRVVVDPTVPDPPSSKEQQRKDVCVSVAQSPSADPLLKALCATF